MKRVLIIDDELAMPGNAQVFATDYATEGFTFEFCGTYEEAVRVGFWDYALILLDIRFEGRGDEHGIEILRKIRSHSPSVPVVMLSSRTTPDILIRCWDAGAQAYVVKWISNRKFKRELQEKMRRFAREPQLRPIIGSSDAIRELRRTVDTLAAYDIAVLITGETGTGKELVARALHEQGRRSEGAFVPVNCGAIPVALVESELFGHVKGAFTGAMTDRRGKVEEADKGTLFLDEVADLPLEIQVKLLRLLDTGEYVRLGENTPRRANIRVVAATNKELRALVKENRFREDLFFRLDGFKIHVLSLREHREDIPVLARHFLESFERAHPTKSHVRTASPGCIRTLQAYAWPGNIRELRNVVERAAILANGGVIEPAHLPENVLASSGQAGPTGMAAGEKKATPPKDVQDWSRERFLAELRLASEAKRRVQSYKGGQWKAEFMRLIYPGCKAANAKGLSDLVRRLTKGPWGYPQWQHDKECRAMLEELLR